MGLKCPNCQKYFSRYILLDNQMLQFVRDILVLVHNANLFQLSNSLNSKEIYPYHDCKEMTCIEITTLGAKFRQTITI